MVLLIGFTAWSKSMEKTSIVLYHRPSRKIRDDLRNASKVDLMARDNAKGGENCSQSF